MNTPSQPTRPIANSTDSAKLVSLLALAAGAVALPQTSQADIIYTDMSSSPVTVGYAGAASFLFNNLPGTANIGAVRQQGVFYTSPGSLTVNYRAVLVGDLGGGAPGTIRGIGDVAAPLAFGATWDQGPAAIYYNIPAGTANDLNGRTPLNGYNNQYFAWAFADSTSGGALRYGWIEVSLSMANYPTGPNLTIFGYAYDNTGAKPTMGQEPVPEPSSAALMVVGALMLGARGVRNWRQKSEIANKS